MFLMESPDFDFLGTRPAVSFHVDAVVPKVFTDVLVESLPNHNWDA